MSRNSQNQDSRSGYELKCNILIQGSVKRHKSTTLPMNYSKHLLALVAFALCTFETLGQADHLRLTIVFQQDSTVQIVANYTIQKRQSDSVYFILNPGIQPLSVSAEGLLDQQMAPKADRPFPFWMLTFEEESKKEKVAVEFKYTINLKQMNHIHSNWIELNVDKLWFPNCNDLDNEFTWEATIEGLYEGYSLMSYETNKGRFIPKVFMEPRGPISLQNPEPTPEVFLMAGSNMQLWDAPSRQGKTQLFVTKNEVDSTLQAIGKQTDDIIRFYNDAFKVNPIDDYLVVLRNTQPGEINFLQSRGNVLLGNSFASGASSISHEVSHYWWSKADFINEPWMNESFANYSMLLLLESKDKDQFEKQWKRINEGSTEGGAVRNSSTFDPNGMATYYYKGAKLLWELDEKIGREAFISLLASRIKKDANSTEAFLNLLEASQGKEIQEAFAEKLD